MKALYRLAATSKSFRDLIHHRSNVFRYMDLTNVEYLRRTLFHESTQDEKIKSDLSPDDFFARPLRKVFRSLQSHEVLQTVRTLILDGLTVPACLVREIICDEAYNIRILSLRGTGELGSGKLLQLLRYVIRPSRPDGTPKLKGLYIFTPTDAAADYNAADLRLRRLAALVGVTNSVGAQLGAGASSSGALHRDFVQSSWHQSNPWYSSSGTEVFRVPSDNDAEQWASLIEACSSLIAFDAVLCRQRRHVVAFPEDNDSTGSDEPNCSARPSLATVSLGGCQECGSCPESPAYPGISPEQQLPLLAPPPLHSSSVKAAQRLYTNGLPHPPLIARCRQCLKDRWCERCNAWWCESCYTVPTKRVLVKREILLDGKKGRQESIKVHNTLCVGKCLIDQLFNESGEGGMWG